MQKIPTVFERDWEGDRSRVLEHVTPGCEWVLAGEGEATRKYDGTSCLVDLRDGDLTLFKRFEVKPGKPTPDGFVQVDARTAETGGEILTGWVPVGEGPEDKWHNEAFVALLDANPDTWAEDLLGTYELLGPKIQKNPEGAEAHVLVAHEKAERYIVPRTYEGMKETLAALINDGVGIEGFVFHHEDGRMAKIKARDFGIRRPTPAHAQV